MRIGSAGVGVKREKRATVLTRSRSKRGPVRFSWPASAASAAGASGSG